MKTYWNTAFKRDYKCTSIAAIKAERLPAGYDPKIWRENGYQAKPTTGGMMRLSVVHQNGEQFEQWGYL